MPCLGGNLGSPFMQKSNNFMEFYFRVCLCSSNSKSLPKGKQIVSFCEAKNCHKSRPGFSFPKIPF